MSLIKIHKKRTDWNGLLLTTVAGFHMTFPNGWTVSVQTGTMNHCDDDGQNAEVWAWNDDTGERVDAPSGYQRPAEILAYMNEIAAK